MKLRTFLARDMREALASVRAEMGPEAVIVASERAKGGGIAVRAALDEQPNDGAAPEVGVEPQVSPASFEEHYRAGLIKRLRVGAQQTRGRASRNFDRVELLAILRRHRAPDMLAHELAEIAEKSQLGDMSLALASALDKRMRTSPFDFAKCGAIIVCGPPGVGKTTTAAKIAAHGKLAGRNVRLIASDTAGAGAVARLETFAAHIGASAIAADGAAAVQRLIAEAAGEGALAVIDTAGFDPRHAKSRTAFAALARVDGMEAVGVLSATTDAEETVELAGALATLGASRVIVTCLDLMRRSGAVAAAATQNIALAHVSRSPFIAAGLDTLSPLSLARLLIEAERADRTSPQ